MNGKKKRRKKPFANSFYRFLPVLPIGPETTIRLIIIIFYTYVLLLYYVGIGCTRIRIRCARRISANMRRLEIFDAVVGTDRSAYNIIYTRAHVYPLAVHGICNIQYRINGKGCMYI